MTKLNNTVAVEDGITALLPQKGPDPFKTAFIGFCAFLLGMVAYNTFARASSFDDIINGSYKLYHGARGACSMQAIGKGKDEKILFLTNFHCVDSLSDELNIQVLYEDDKFNVLRRDVVYLNVVKTDRAKDLALLETKYKIDKEIPLVDIATDEELKEVKIGTETFSVGYPKALEITFTQGYWTGYVKSPVKAFESPLVRNTAPITYGNSGGGLYIKNKEGEFKLIGTALGKWPDSEFMNYYTPLAGIKSFLKGLVSFETKEATPTVTKEVEKSSKKDLNHDDLGDGPERN